MKNQLFIFIFTCLLNTLFGQGSVSDASGKFHSTGVPTLSGYPSGTICINDLTGTYYTTNGSTWQESPGHSSAVTAFSPITGSSTSWAIPATNVQSAVETCSSGIKRLLDSIQTLHRAELNTLNAALNAAPKYVKVSGSIPTTAITLSDVTGAAFPVLAGTKYHFRITVGYNSAATTTGAGFSVNGPALTTLNCAIATGSSATANTLRNISAYNTFTATTATPATTGNVATLEGFVQCSAAGNVQLRFASEISASAITVTSVRIEYQKL